jgi:hypothetical protein
VTQDPTTRQAVTSIAFGWGNLKLSSRRTDTAGKQVTSCCRTLCFSGPAPGHVLGPMAAIAWPVNKAIFPPKHDQEKPMKKLP